MKFTNLTKFNNIPISIKITAFSLTIGIGSLVAMGALQSKAIKESALERQGHLLETVTQERADQIESAFEFVQEQILQLSTDKWMAKAMASFDDGFSELASIEITEDDLQSLS